MMQPRMGGIIQANIPDVETLYLSYMPYCGWWWLICTLQTTCKNG